jgi:flagellum-specific peptidoglycan hydrolase FlgJ
MKTIFILLLAVMPLIPVRASDFSCSVKTGRLTSEADSSGLFPDAPVYVAEFFGQHLPLARKLSMHFRIPAAVILSVAALESGYGQADSRVIQECFNYFNIKTWKDSDPTCCKMDDNPARESCFRKYEEPEGSFWDFCRMMHTGKYRIITNLPRWDYRAWAEELHQAGYATDPEYAQKLITIIEKYDLNRFDPMPIPHPYELD